MFCSEHIDNEKHNCINLKNANNIKILKSIKKEKV